MMRVWLRDRVFLTLFKFVYTYLLYIWLGSICSTYLFIIYLFGLNLNLKKQVEFDWAENNLFGFVKG